MTRSPGPIGSSTRNIRDSASTKAAALRWVTATPFGLPVDPEVKITQASSSVPGGAGSIGERPCPTAVVVTTRSLPMIAAAADSSKTTRARSSGSSASTGT